MYIFIYAITIRNIMKIINKNIRKQSFFLCLIQKLFLIIVLDLFFISSVLTEAPEVEVNYLPKKQWKMSKHDMADLKLDLERELRAKILQMQIDWKNKENTEEYMIRNQQYQTPQIIPPSLSFPYNNQNFQGYGNPANSYNNMNVFPSLSNSRTAMTHRNFDVKRIEDKLDHVISRVKDNKVNGFFRDTISEVNDLKSKLDHAQLIGSKLLSFKEKEDSSVNGNNVVEKNGDNDNWKKEDGLFGNLIKEENNINNIINKYHSNFADKEIKVFTKIFSKYNSTVHDVDFSKINEEISSYSDLLTNYSDASDIAHNSTINNDNNNNDDKEEDNNTTSYRNRNKNTVINNKIKSDSSNEINKEALKKLDIIRNKKHRETKTNNNLRKNNASSLDGNQQSNSDIIDYESTNGDISGIINQSNRPVLSFNNRKSNINIKINDSKNSKDNKESGNTKNYNIIGISNIENTSYGKLLSELNNKIAPIKEKETNTNISTKKEINDEKEIKEGPINIDEI